MGPPFISFRLLSEGGLGAPGTEVQGFAGYCAPSPDRRSVENPSGLGAKGTEVQGFEGKRAPSPGRRPKTFRDLVHWERRHKVLRVIVHQVRAPPGGPKTVPF